MITRQTKIVLFDFKTRNYEIATMETRTGDQVPVCTIRHFFNKVCTLFEEIYPSKHGR